LIYCPKYCPPLSDIFFAEGENRTYSIEIQAFLPELAIIDDFIGLGDENHFRVHTSGRQWARPKTNPRAAALRVRENLEPWCSWDSGGKDSD
jgi:hypothetical protein